MRSRNRPFSILNRPLPALALFVALEAILLASFILMRQGLLAKRADERSHLMLQLLLLAEKEMESESSRQHPHES